MDLLQGILGHIKRSESIPKGYTDQLKVNNNELFLGGTRRKPYIEGEAHYREILYNIFVYLKGVDNDDKNRLYYEFTVFEKTEIKERGKKYEKKIVKRIYRKANIKSYDMDYVESIELNNLKHLPEWDNVAYFRIYVSDRGRQNDTEITKDIINDLLNESAEENKLLSELLNSDIDDLLNKSAEENKLLTELLNNNIAGIEFDFSTQEMLDELLNTKPVIDSELKTRKTIKKKEEYIDTWIYYINNEKGKAVPINDLTKEQYDNLDKLDWKLIRKGGVTYKAIDKEGKIIKRKKVKKLKKKLKKKTVKEDTQSGSEITIHQNTGVKEDTQTGPEITIHQKDNDKKDKKKMKKSEKVVLSEYGFEEESSSTSSEDPSKKPKRTREKKEKKKMKKSEKIIVSDEKVEEESLSTIDETTNTSDIIQNIGDIGENERSFDLDIYVNPENIPEKVVLPEYGFEEESPSTSSEDPGKKPKRTGEKKEKKEARDEKQKELEKKEKKKTRDEKQKELETKRKKETTEKKIDQYSSKHPTPEVNIEKEDIDKRSDLDKVETGYDNTGANTNDVEQKVNNELEGIPDYISIDGEESGDSNKMSEGEIEEEEKRKQNEAIGKLENEGKKNDQYFNNHPTLDVNPEKEGIKESFSSTEKRTNINVNTENNPRKIILPKKYRFEDEPLSTSSEDSIKNPKRTREKKKKKETRVEEQKELETKRKKETTEKKIDQYLNKHPTSEVNPEKERDSNKMSEDEIKKILQDFKEEEKRKQNEAIRKLENEEKEKMEEQDRLYKIMKIKEEKLEQMKENMKQITELNNFDHIEELSEYEMDILNQHKKILKEIEKTDNEVLQSVLNEEETIKREEETIHGILIEMKKQDIMELKGNIKKCESELKDLNNKRTKIVKKLNKDKDKDKAKAPYLRLKEKKRLSKKKTIENIIEKTREKIKDFYKRIYQLDEEYEEREIEKIQQQLREKERKIEEYNKELMAIEIEEQKLMKQQEPSKYELEELSKYLPEESTESKLRNDLEKQEEKEYEEEEKMIEEAWREFEWMEIRKKLILRSIKEIDDYVKYIEKYENEIKRIESKPNKSRSKKELNNKLISEMKKYITTHKELLRKHFDMVREKSHKFGHSDLEKIVIEKYNEELARENQRKKDRLKVQKEEQKQEKEATKQNTTPSDVEIKEIETQIKPTPQQQERQLQEEIINKTNVIEYKNQEEEMKQKEIYNLAENIVKEIMDYERKYSSELNNINNNLSTNKKLTEGEKGILLKRKEILENAIKECCENIEKYYEIIQLIQDNKISYEEFIKTPLGEMAIKRYNEIKEKQKRNEEIAREMKENEKREEKLKKQIEESIKQQETAVKLDEIKEKIQQEYREQQLILNQHNEINDDQELERNYNPILEGLRIYLQNLSDQQDLPLLPDLRFDRILNNRLVIFRNRRGGNGDEIGRYYRNLMEYIIMYSDDVQADNNLLIELNFRQNGQEITRMLRPHILANELRIAEDEIDYWEHYEDYDEDRLQILPPFEWVTEIAVRCINFRGENIQHGGHLFPFSLKNDAKELLEDIECLGIYECNVFNTVTKEDIRLENCFMKSLETWNQWLSSNKYLEVYIKNENNKWVPKYNIEYKNNIIEEGLMKSIRRRLIGKRVSKSTLKKICEDYNLKIKLTTITYKNLEEMTEKRQERTIKMIEKRDKNNTHAKYEIIKNGNKYLRTHISEYIGTNRNCYTKEIKLGLIMFGIYGHYFADIDLNMSKSGIENYYKIKGRGGRNVYTYRERITGIYERNGHDGYDRFRLNKKIIDKGMTIYTTFNPAHMVVDWMICTPDDQTMLYEIPNKLKYYVMPECITKIDMENIDIWDEDCELIEYNEKNDEDIYFVADTECIVGERHYPYTIAWCELGKDNIKTNCHLGWNCIDSFIKWFETNKILKKRVFDKKTKKQNKKIIVYFHNLSYDGRLFVDHEIRSINMNGNKIIQMKIAITKSYCICLRDSLMLVPSKLANFPKMFKTNEKSKQVFPYTFITEKIINDIIENDMKEVNLNTIINSQTWNLQQTNEFINTLEENNCLYDGEVVDVEKMIKMYVLSDVKILSQGLKIFTDKVKLTLGMNLLNYISISSLAHAYMTKEAYSGENLYKYRGETRDYIRRAVTGGRCMTSQNKSWKIINTPIIDMDACSLYPSAMSRMKIPKGKPKKFIPTIYKTIDGVKYFTDEDKNNIIYRLNLPDNHPDKINSLVIYIKITKIGVELDFPLIYERDENGVLNYVNKVGVKMMIDDTTLLELIKWQQIEFDIIECIYWNEGYSDKINHVIRKLYNERKKAKEENNIIQEVYKLIMNSCYGKCIEKPHLKKYIVVRGEEEKNKHLYSHYLMVNKITCIKSFDQKHIINELEEAAIECESTELQLNINKTKENIEKLPQYIFEEYVDYDDFAAPVMIGVKVLSESKKIMNSVMCSAEKEGIKIYYQDTDSMHLEKSKVEKLEQAWRKHNNKDYRDKLYGTDMCQFHSDFEKINNMDTYSCYSIFLGKKMYMDLLIPNNIEFNGNIGEIENASKVMCRMKGIPLKSIEEYDDDDNMYSDVMKKINIYERLYDDDSLIFDLVQGGKIIGFSKDLQIFSLEEFKRQIKRPNVTKYLVENGEIIEEI